MKIGIIVADFYAEIAEKMLELAKEKAKELGAEVAKVYHVPGSFDIPLFVKKLLEQEDIEGVATFGAIVRGETDHDQIIGHSVSNSLIELSLQYRKPVTMGVTGPGQTYEQAAARVGKAGEIVEACVKMIRELKK